MTDVREPIVRYRVTLGDPFKGEDRNCASLAGARRSAKYWRDQGWPVTVWEGTKRSWGGWSWSTIDV